MAEIPLGHQITGRCGRVDVYVKLNSLSQCSCERSLHIFLRLRWRQSEKIFSSLNESLTRLEFTNFLVAGSAFLINSRVNNNRLYFHSDECDEVFKKKLHGATCMTGPLLPWYSLQHCTGPLSGARTGEGRQLAVLPDPSPALREAGPLWTQHEACLLRKPECSRKSICAPNPLNKSSCASRSLLAV